MPSPPIRTLGTLLRALLESLDAAVAECYRAADLDYRPRFTPVVRALLPGPLSIRGLEQETGVSHSAVSQTVAEMARAGLVLLAPGKDRRAHIVRLSPKAEAILPRLERQWQATEIAARSLDADLGQSLPQILERALAALDERDFAQRIAAAMPAIPTKER